MGHREMTASQDWGNLSKEEIIKALSKPTITPAVAGSVYGLKKNATYEAIRRGEIKSLRFGHKIVIPTAPIRKQLGLDEAATGHEGAPPRSATAPKPTPLRRKTHEPPLPPPETELGLHAHTRTGAHRSEKGN
jgi:hypothetical protein